MIVLGFSVGKDRGAVIIKDSKVIIGISEERLSRFKHDRDVGYDNVDELPINSIDYCLNHVNLTYNDIDLYTYTTTLVEETMEQQFIDITGVSADKLNFIPHHLAHAYSTFYSSGFEDAIVVVADGMGSMLSPKGKLRDWYTGSTDSLEDDYMLAEAYAVYNFDSNPNTCTETYKKWQLYPMDTADNMLAKAFEGQGVSIGYAYGRGAMQLIYDPDTNSWPAGKLMGLASYADKDFVKKEPKDFHFTDTDMVIPNKLLYPEISHESDFQVKADVAGLYQRNQQEYSIQLAKIGKKLGKSKNVCFAGGSFLNCNTNELMLKSGMFEKYYFIPSADDSGTPLGCAYYANFKLNGKIKHKNKQLNPYLGKKYTEEEIYNTIKHYRLNYKKFEKFEDIVDITAEMLRNNKVVGWMQDGSETGPRALGNRSILASPKEGWMTNYINSEIKFREWYRPFAPSVLYEHQSEVFNLTEYSPYMLITTTVKDEWISKIPAVTHFDKTSRLQSVSKKDNLKYHQLITAFYEQTGIPLVLNTSFNGPHEPIVETPEDAINTFIKQNLYCVIINNFLITKNTTL